MQARIDHVVLWVSDPAASLDFYEQVIGARGIAPHAFYFRDPDGNVLEARYYAD